LKSGSINLLETSGPDQAWNGIDLALKKKKKYHFPDIIPALSFLDLLYRDEEHLRREAILFRT
jgi:hypothetical protein